MEKIKLMKEQLSNIYQSRTYEEISKEFQELFPSVVRTFQLISQMYNRLTLVDEYSHKEAIIKIFEDHKQLPGFSRRNIYRALPSDNPNVPRRVVPPRHKSSHTESNGSNKLSSTKLSSQLEKNPKEKIHDVEAINDSSEVECRRCIVLTAKNQELEEALLASSRCTQAKNLIGKEIVYEIPKEKIYLLTESMKKSDKRCFAIFDDTGRFLYAESDLERMTRAVSHNGTIE